MASYEFDEPFAGDDSPRPRLPHRKSTGPGRERKQKARRASTRKQGGVPVGGMHRRGSSRRGK